MSTEAEQLMDDILGQPKTRPVKPKGKKRMRGDKEPPEDRKARLTALHRKVEVFRPDNNQLVYNGPFSDREFIRSDEMPVFVRHYYGIGVSQSVCNKWIRSGMWASGGRRGGGRIVVFPHYRGLSARFVKISDFHAAIQECFDLVEKDAKDIKFKYENSLTERIRESKNGKPK